MPSSGERRRADNADRRRLYDGISAVFKDGFARYYGEFPERLGDARSSDGLAWAMRGLARVLQLIDGYEVRLRDEHRTKEAP
jgi:hypothetical protein